MAMCKFPNSFTRVIVCVSLLIATSSGCSQFAGVNAAVANMENICASSSSNSGKLPVVITSPTAIVDGRILLTSPCIISVVGTSLRIRHSYFDTQSLEVILYPSETDTKPELEIDSSYLSSTHAGDMLTINTDNASSTIALTSDHISYASGIELLLGEPPGIPISQLLVANSKLISDGSQGKGIAFIVNGPSKYVNNLFQSGTVLGKASLATIGSGPCLEMNNIGSTKCLLAPTVSSTSGNEVH